MSSIVRHVNAVTRPIDRSEIETGFIMPKLIKILVLENGGCLSCDMKEVVFIGRQNDQQRIDLDVDVHEGYALGVSRIHAAFVAKDGYLYVRDLSSANGTHLNRKLLIPGKLYPVNHLDILKVGRMHLKIFFDGRDGGGFLPC